MGLWEAVRVLVADGVAVLLTTQYLEEADELADRVAVLDRGRIVAEGTPEELKRKVGQERLVVTMDGAQHWPLAVAVLGRMAVGELDIDERRLTMTLQLSDPLLDTSRAAAELDRAGVVVSSLALRHPSLDEVFLQLTGQLGTGSVPASGAGN
jgi:ABC-2 type transport system ATP-binding protein